MSWAEAKWIVDNVGSNVGGGFVEYDTAGSYTFTVPAGVTIISVTACGGGGGGGTGNNSGSSTSYGGPGGGGGAAVVGRKFAVTPGQTLAITVGAGGTVSSNTTTGKGGDTVIGALLTLGGGYGGGGDGAPGGVPGGDGGGCGGCGGGNPWGHSDDVLRYSGSTLPEYGMNGITGCGGNRGANGSRVFGGGGGGGSLGNGGNGARYELAATPGSRGGGGGGQYYGRGMSEESDAAKGGAGYVRIGWGVCMD